MEEKQGIEEKIHRIAHYYGAASQLDQTIEELAELTVAIRKFKRNSGNNISKLKKRYPEGFSEQASINRTE